MSNEKETSELVRIMLGQQPPPSSHRGRRISIVTQSMLLCPHSTTMVLIVAINVLSYPSSVMLS